MSKTFSFIKGLLLGATIGAVAGILLAPKSGKETREDIAKLAQKVQGDALNYIEEAKSAVMQKIEALKKVGKRLDEQKYLAIVNEVVDQLKSDKQLTVDAAKKIGSQLKRDWKKVQTALNPVEVAAKK